MSTWRIFSDAGNNFRWEGSDRKPLPPPQPDLPEFSGRTTSVADLLLEVAEEVVDDSDEEDNVGQVFRTGSGKKLEVKQSSIDRARAVLGGLNVETADLETNELKSWSLEKADVCSSSSSLFQTASGKTVDISPLGLMKAKALLGLEEKEDSNVKDFSSPASSCVTNDPHYGKRENDAASGDPKSVSSGRFKFEITVPEGERRKSSMSEQVMPAKCSSTLNPPPIKFQTAGGRSISVSSEALKRARSLLGDPDIGDICTEAGASSVGIPLFLDRRVADRGLIRESETTCVPPSLEREKENITPKCFISPLRPSPHNSQLSLDSCKTSSGTNLIDKFNEEDSDCVYKSNNVACIPKPKCRSIVTPQDAKMSLNSEENGVNNSSVTVTCHGKLLDISNRIDTTLKKQQQGTGEKRKFGRRHSASPSPFKRPRSRFSAPLVNNGSAVTNGPFITLASEHSFCKQNVSARYPFQATRLSALDYFGVPASQQHMVESLSPQLNIISSDNAQNYVFFDGSSSAGVGVERIADMLVQTGAQKQYASKEWIANHYKWIVWKLACYDRGYPAKPGGNFLSVTNVLEELKYRYEREVNHGHRSAIKRILEGDASPSSMMVLCISAIYSNHNTSPPSSATRDCNMARVELTDGWYSIDAVMDALLLKQLAAGKLFVGQKLRVWGARFCGWVGPISPLEAPRTVNLSLHLNGTYRAHWADRLGLCKSVGAPLAFRCIKVGGGPVPQTLVIIKRIYPLLYKEKFPNGDSVIRSEKLEAKARHSFNQRRLLVVETITCSQKDTSDCQTNNDSDSDENIKLLKKLEMAAEPELLMAEMSKEQLASFSTYHTKMKETRHFDMSKSITKALADAGLVERNVSPFMRVKVAGLWSKSCQRKQFDKDGIITIWEPTEKQRHELIEGQPYAVSGLVALSSDSSLLYCSARGSSSRWRSLSPQVWKHFETSYVPRMPVCLSNLGHVSLSSEFDMAGLVVYVGEVFKAVNQKKQWIFVTDCSTSDLSSEEVLHSLLAIHLYLPERIDDLSSPISSNLVGSTVGFCNLVKEGKDQQNQVWVAKMTENSIYCLNYDLSYCSHLKDAAAAVIRWSSTSSLIVEKLRQKVLSIVGDGEL
uniref:Tower domain-containing protein n=1 Tax=Kalanchoe fedtschenkoi TaxID=63787 RepID=A0A7N0VDX0_KALFE